MFPSQDLIHHRLKQVFQFSRIGFLLALIVLFGVLRTSIVLAQKLAAPKAAEGEAADSDGYDKEWVQIEENEESKPVSLQTAIGRYTYAEGPLKNNIFVDLIGAIHIGDKSYYADLNKRFDQYDALLYELVAPEGTVIQRGARSRSDNPLAAMQNGMKDMLDLEHQLEEIDYTKRNFVHADMSFDELLASMKTRDESVAKLYFRLMGQAIGEQTKSQAKGKSAEMDMLFALMSSGKDRSRKLKIAMAGQMTEMEGLLTSFGGEKGTSLIHERNRVALEVLEKQIDQAKSNRLFERTFGVFYGAGHLADMDRRLRDDFGLVQVSKEWLNAWDMTDQE